MHGDGEADCIALGLGLDERPVVVSSSGIGINQMVKSEEAAEKVLLTSEKK